MLNALATKILELDGLYPPVPGETRIAEQEFTMLGIDWAELVGLAQAQLRTTERPRPYKLAIVACSASKLRGTHPAKDLYTGQLFRLARAVAEKMAERWVILSARHGVVFPEALLESYDQKLPADKQLRGIWGSGVVNELSRVLGVKDRADVKECETLGKGVLCLAPGSYIDAIGFMYGTRNWRRPLRGLGIGQQKAELKRLLEAA